MKNENAEDIDWDIRSDGRITDSQIPAILNDPLLRSDQFSAVVQFLLKGDPRKWEHAVTSALKRVYGADFRFAPKPLMLAFYHRVQKWTMAESFLPERLRPSVADSKIMEVLIAVGRFDEADEVAAMNRRRLENSDCMDEVEFADRVRALTCHAFHRQNPNEALKIWDLAPCGRLDWVEGLQGKVEVQLVLALRTVQEGLKALRQVLTKEECLPDEKPLAKRSPVRKVLAQLQDFETQIKAILPRNSPFAIESKTGVKA